MKSTQSTVMAGVFLAILLYLLPAIIAIARLMKSGSTGLVRMFWLAVILFFPVVGSLLYIFGGSRQQGDSVV